MHLRLLSRGTLLTLSIVGVASSVAAAPPPTIDGDIDDVLAFLAEGSACGLSINDPLQDVFKTDALLVPCAPEVGCCGGLGTYFTNGLDLTLGVAAYDAGTQTLYLGMRTAGNIGDSNGDLDPGNVCALPGANVTDVASISNQEQYLWEFDTNGCDQLSDILIMVRGDQVIVFGASPSATNYAFNGTELEASVSGINLPALWGMRLFAGSTTDGLNEDVTAFECPPALTCGAVQASAETWGRIKAFFR